MPMTQGVSYRGRKASNAGHCWLPGNTAVGCPGSSGLG